MVAIVLLLAQAIVNIAVFSILIAKTGDFMAVAGIFLGCAELLVSVVSLFIARIDKKGN